MKKIIIAKHGGGELANQLWNYASVYACGLELGVTVKNPSFYEYHSFFRFLQRESVHTKLRAIFFRTPQRRSSILSKKVRVMYSIGLKITGVLRKKCTISSQNALNKPLYLPPTMSLPSIFSTCESLYVEGWLTRNPAGLKKWRNEIVDAFKPTEKIGEKVEAFIASLGNAYTKIIGIHIRQSDYKDFKGGAYLIDQKRVREIINEYMKKTGLESSKTAFIIASDGAVDKAAFDGLNIYVSKENAVTDLFILSKTDAILGSDSSFGEFAAWYGDIPHIIFKKEAMDWDYYKDKTSFFENKYCTMLAY